MKQYLSPNYFERVQRLRPSGEYIEIGKKISIYCETYGRGKPLLLLHGGLSAIEGLRYQISYFSRFFKVIVPERPGHGRTADIAGPYSYEAMAVQTAQLMERLRIKKARFLGYSDGANLLFWLAAQRPDLVDRFISVGGNFHFKGCDPVFQRQLKNQRISMDERYAAISPDGAAHYPSVFEKCRSLWLKEPRWSKKLINRIKAPGLIAAGDRDMILHEHSLEAFSALRRGQLAIFPGTTHGLLKEKPLLINPVFLDFLTQTFSTR